MSHEQVSALESDDPPNRSQLRITVGGPGADIGGLHNRAIDAALGHVSSRGGGLVELTEGEFAISDVVYLRDNVTLRGQGEKTILKKCDVVRSALAVDTDSIERTVTLADAVGFDVGMGLTIGDDRHAFHGNEMVLTIAWKSGHTLGFTQPMKGLAMDARGGYAQTTFPVLYGAGVENVRVENLVLDGNKEASFYVEDLWKDGVIYLDGVSKTTVSNCVARNSNGFCIMVLGGSDVRIGGCQVHDNAKEGIHVGVCQRFAVRDCRIHGNATEMANRGGLYLCFNARTGIYERNEIWGNRGAGILIGYRDGNNLFENNIIRDNSRAGVFYRTDTYRTYGNVFRDCVIEDNGDEAQGYGFYVAGDAHHLLLEGCTVRDTRPAGSKRQRFGLYVGAGVEDVKTVGCTIRGNAEKDTCWAQRGGA